MAGMKRFVTYIYTYEDGKKGNNAGFAKIEIRGADCRVEIHMRGIFAWRGTGRVFLFRKAEDRMEGVRIGEIRPVNGGGSLAVMVRSEKIGDTPFGIGDMEGIFILSEDDRIFMSRWREGELPEVSKERFHEWQPDLSRGGNAQTEPAGQPELRGRDDGDVRPGVSEGVSGRVQSDRPAVREDLHRQSQPGGTKGIPGPGQSRQPAVREDPHRQSQPAASETAENMPSVAARPKSDQTDAEYAYRAAAKSGSPVSEKCSGSSVRKYAAVSGDGSPNTYGRRDRRDTAAGNIRETAGGNHGGTAAGEY